MIIKGITDEDFINYKVPSMYIATATCSFKCDREFGSPICQNSSLAKTKSISAPDDQIINRYMQNLITHAIVFGGLEPFDQLMELGNFIKSLRAAGCDDDVVIYTGYTKEELESTLAFMFASERMPRKNLIIKYGRFIPGQEPHFDEVLGVYLASDNQYAERISDG